MSEHIRAQLKALCERTGALLYYQSELDIYLDVLDRMKDWQARAGFIWMAGENFTHLFAVGFSGPQNENAQMIYDTCKNTLKVAAIIRGGEVEQVPLDRVATYLSVRPMALEKDGRIIDRGRPIGRMRLNHQYRASEGRYEVSFEHDPLPVVGLSDGLARSFALDWACKTFGAFTRLVINE